MTSDELEERLRGMLLRLRDSRGEFDRLTVAEMEADAKKRAELRALRASLTLDLDALPAQIEVIERQRLEALLSELQEEQEQLVEQQRQAYDELGDLAEREREAERILEEVKHARFVAKQRRERLQNDIQRSLGVARATTAILTSRPAELRKLVEEDVNKAIYDCSLV